LYNGYSAEDIDATAFARASQFSNQVFKQTCAWTVVWPKEWCMEVTNCPPHEDVLLVGAELAWIERKHGAVLEILGYNSWFCLN
jgi:hypothetical protein